MLVSFCNQITDNPGTSAQPSWLAEDANSPPLAFHGLTVFLAQAHRSAMVSAVGANAGLITCGIFGSIMWWPEAELRSCVEAAGMRLPSEERARSFIAGKEAHDRPCPKSCDATSRRLRLRWRKPHWSACTAVGICRGLSALQMGRLLSLRTQSMLTAGSSSPPTQQSTAAHMLSCQIFGLILRVLHTLVSGTVGTTMLYYVLVPCKH